MTDAATMLWRAPMPADWTERAKAMTARLKAGATGDASETEIELRRLAGCRLTPSAQLQMQRLAHAYAAANLAAEHMRRLRIGLLGANTLSFLAAPLAAAGPVRGLIVDVVEAAYDQLAPFAYGAASPFGDATLDAVVVVLDADAFGSGDDAAALIDALAARIRALGATPIVATLPAPAAIAASGDLVTATSTRRRVAAINDHIVASAAQGRWRVWDMDGLAARVGYDRWHDPVRYHLAKIPFAVDLAPLAADHLAALLAAMAGKAPRAAIVDLDNMLWGGVIGDDGVEGIRIGQNSAEGEAFVAVQRHLLALRERGVVLTVCSKNSDATARQPFRDHPDMLLREEHFALFQANWNDKASNVRAIADALRLGEDALVFLDDNPAERDRVRQELPLVHVPEMGDDPAYYPRLLLQSGLFEHLPLTPDDRTRAEAYGAEARRVAVRDQIGSYDDYLRSLGMAMTIRRFDAVGLPRIAQLVSKSNQFNLRSIRYNEAQLGALGDSPDRLCWQVRLTDRFGDHGMIAVVIVDTSDEEWFIDSWLQSCRILERGVEAAIMNALEAAATAAGAARIIGEYFPNARNALVADFYPRMGFAARGDEEGRFALELAARAPRSVQIAVDIAP
jgi:FkbH-like protein